jgi:hypothetical protein
LRFANCELGLLINDGQDKINDDNSRVVNGREDEMKLA